MKPDLGLGQRLALAFGAVGLLLVGLAAFVLDTSNHLLQQGRRIQQVIQPRADAADRMREATLRKGLTLRSFALSGDARYEDAFRAATVDEERAFEALRSLPRGDTANERWAAIVARREAYNRGVLRLFGTVAKDPGASFAAKSAEIELTRMREDLLAELDAFSAAQRARLQQALAEINAARLHMQRSTIGLTLLLLVAGTIGAVVATNSVRRPTQRLVAVAHAAERGDFAPALALEPPAGAAPRDEMTRIGAALAFLARSVMVRERRLEQDARLAQAAAASVDVDAVAAGLLGQLLPACGAEVGAVYVKDDGRLRRVAAHALEQAPPFFKVGEGLVGEAARRTLPLVVREIPRDTPFTLRLGVDEVPPRCLAAAPLVAHGTVVAVVLLAWLRDPADADLEVLGANGPVLASGLRNALLHAETVRLAGALQGANEGLAAQNEELQAQAEEIQAQNEELQAQAETIHAQNEELRAQNEEVQGLWRDLRARNDELGEAAREKDAFVAMLSHELRNPLGAMQNAIALVRSVPPDQPAFPQALEILERQVRHQSRLVDDLLDVSRFALHKVVLERETLDLALLVRQAASECARGFADREIACTLDVPDHPAWVAGDRVRLAQVVSNLLVNAQKFTPPGGRVAIELGVEESTAEAVVRVTDDGIGIAPDILPRLFRPLFQADCSIDRARGGLGLGLSIVKGVVEQLGGSVAARSEGQGKGAAFEFRLPLVPAPAGLDAVGARRTTGASLGVLLVEDHLDCAETLRALLSSWGHRVVVAATGPEGLDAALADRFDLLLCDLGLPGFDGFELAHRLRADGAAPGALIAISGYGSDAHRERALAAGFERLLVKPVLPEVLAPIIEALATRSAEGGHEGRPYAAS